MRDGQLPRHFTMRTRRLGRHGRVRGGIAEQSPFVSFISEVDSSCCLLVGIFVIIYENTVWKRFVLLVSFCDTLELGLLEGEGSSFGLEAHY